jgi:pyruvate dehydrogenase E2 component (dihydrolipoamide acetyltransferase)
MRTEVVMPQMGESVVEGTVTQWFKSLGQAVQRDEPLFEITTDKVDVEVPSPSDGVLIEICAQPGETVAINNVVAVLDNTVSEGDVPEASPLEVSPPAVNASVDVAAAVTSVEESRATVEPATEVGSDAATLRRTRSTPLVRKMAKEHGIANLAAIRGTGLSGRVTKGDLLTYIAAQRSASHSVAAVEARPGDRVETMSVQRKAIAEHMIASRRTSAHAHTVHEVDFSRVVAAKAALGAVFQKRDARLTYTAFLLKAAAEALADYPILGSSVSGDQIVYRGQTDIGVAVDTGASLIVPVLRQVDERSLLGIARELGDLTSRARTKKLHPDEVKGGSFTISNPGIFGSEFGVPIINQPQTAILVTGAIKKRVVADQVTGAIMVRPTSMWCLSFDHRVIDGATADKFMRRMRQVIEDWPEDGGNW